MSGTPHPGRPVRLAVLVLPMLLASLPILAETGGRLIGTVVDENLQTLPDVLITVSGPGTVGVRRMQTGKDGRYAFLGLPMNQPFIVRADGEGKVAKVYAGIWVRESGDTRRDFRLRPPGHHETLVVLDGKIPSHRIALEGAKKALPGSAIELDIEGQTLADTRRLAEEMLHQPNAVLALGRSAALLARREGRQTPVVFALVPDPAGDNLPASNICGVALNEGLDQQLDRLSTFAPEVRNLVTLFDPRRQGRSVTELERLARQRGMTLTARSVRSLKDVDRRIAKLAQDPGDAVFLLWDPEFFDEQVLGRIRTFVETRDLVYIVPDASLLAARRTFTDGPGFRGMGERAGVLIGEIYRGLEPLNVGIVFPEKRVFESRAAAPAP